MRRSDWFVYAKRPFAGPQAVLAYLSRYTHRVAISNSRLIALDEKRVKWKDYRIKGRDRLKTMTLDAAEFIRRFLLHVLPSDFHRIRHYGLFAGTGRARNIERARQSLPPSAAPPDSDPAGPDNDNEASPITTRGGVLVVVILDLHDLVAGRKGPAEPLDFAFAGGVQRRLQFDVERTRADAAAVYRAKYLDVADQVQAEALGGAGLHQLQDALNGGLGILGRNEVEVAVADRRAEIGNRSLIDAVGVDDDPARRGLPEHLCQAHDGHRARADDVGQDLP